MERKRREMSKCTELGCTAWLVVKIEALLYHFLLWSLELKSTAGKVERVSAGCAVLTTIAVLLEDTQSTWS